MSVVLPKTVPPLLIIAGIIAFYVPFQTQQDDRWKALGVIVAIFLWIVSVGLWYWDREQYYEQKRFEF